MECHSRVGSDTGSGYSGGTFLSQPAISVDSLTKERRTTDGHSPHNNTNNDIVAAVDRLYHLAARPAVSSCDSEDTVVIGNMASTERSLSVTAMRVGTNGPKQSLLMETKCRISERNSSQLCLHNSMK